MNGRTLDLLFGLPLLGAFIVLFAPRQWATAIRRFAVLVTLAELVLAATLVRGDYSQGTLVATSNHGYVWDLGMGIRFGVDGVSAALVLLTALITPIALSYSWTSVTTKVKEHAVCFLLLEAGLVGAFLSTDLFFFYICWELVLIPLYILIGVWGSGERAITSNKFFLYTLAGSLLMLVAILYVGNLYSSLAKHPSYAMEDLRSLVMPLRVQLPLFLAFALAFAIKMPLFPLHTWSPDTYRDAPISVAIMASAVVAKLGGYGLYRFAAGLFPYGAQAAGATIATFAVIGMLYGAYAAWAQRDLKMLLAYASMSHMGYVVLGLFSFTPEGMTGAMVQMLSHGITTAGLFLLVGVVESRAGTRNIDSLSGFAKDRPWLTLLFVVIAFAGAGVPGTSGFVGEFLVLLGTYASSDVPGYKQFNWSFTAFGALTMILGALYILKVLRRVLWGPARAEDASKPDLSWRELVCLAPLAVLVIALGVFPSYAVDHLKPAIGAYGMNLSARYGSGDRATVPYISNPALARPRAAPAVAPGGTAPEGAAPEGAAPARQIQPRADADHPEVEPPPMPVRTPAGFPAEDAPRDVRLAPSDAPPAEEEGNPQ